MEKVIDRLRALSQRRERFTFDLRGNCLVYSGVVAAYRAAQESGHFTDRPKVILHALQHDGIIGAWHDPNGRVFYDSCRVFTDVEQAVHFARTERQHSVYNLNRDEEIAAEAAQVAA